MSEAIPLCAALRIQSPQVIVGKILCQRLDLVLEIFTRKTRRARLV